MSEAKQAPPRRDGLERTKLSARYDLLPSRGVRMAARVMAYGNVARGGRESWRMGPVQGDESALNHALGHLMRALELEPGGVDRLHQLAKASANLLMQVELEASDEREAQWVRKYMDRAEQKGRLRLLEESK